MQACLLPSVCPAFILFPGITSRTSYPASPCLGLCFQGRSNPREAPAPAAVGNNITDATLPMGMSHSSAERTDPE